MSGGYWGYTDGIEDLKGKTFDSVESDSDGITFKNKDEQYRLFHEQDCCEAVNLEDICGNIDDLVGSPIIEAEESCNSGEEKDYEHYTWSFYKIGTVKGFVTLRWYGTSNGYYSETASLYKWKLYER